eukprot:gnl/Hemi2/18533_TR6129_c0_g2_i1.p1 gnl/Hemi2/18533_TR6129_c0_g2~~gnl/Hemi2/18533_TR6129_c0_g2_i1.p1  ORF type:complete len:393 (-),score=131.84 gnl/Hemi2/18533_TR6129_c0_g2_i1:98-1276(-)
MQGWLFTDTSFWQPAQIQALLGPVPNAAMIILDLWSENFPVWSRTDSYYGKPFIWCMLHNFGGNSGLYGSLPILNTAPFAAKEAAGSSMIGVGMTPEGIEQNAVVYEFMAERMWRSGPVDVEQWMRAYVRRRYGDGGALSTKAEDYGVLLLNSVYNCSSIGVHCFTQSEMVLRPSLDMTFTPLYDLGTVEAAWGSLLAAAPALSSKPTYTHDLVDVTRQVLSDRFAGLQANFSAAYKARSSSAVRAWGARLLQLLSDVDRVASCSADFLLGRWLRAARSWGGTPSAARLLEFNARNQLTLWGPAGQITDYASKHWAGLLGSYYLPRWRLFVDQVQAAVDAGQDFDAAKFNTDCSALELAWQTDVTPFPSEPSCDAATVAAQLYAQYCQACKQ